MKDPKDTADRNCRIIDTMFYGLIIILIGIIIIGILGDLGFHLIW